MKARSLHTASVVIEYIHQGQIRAYGDNIYEARLHFSQSYADAPGITRWTPEKDRVKEIAAVLIHPFKEGDALPWYESYLADLVCEEPDVWRVKIVERYAD